MAKLGSFVFFDLETTGLPGLKAPKITEVSLIACSKQHLLDTKHGELPRVMHKQTFCLNPQRMIHPKASETTALYNDLLENESKFDENAENYIPDQPIWVLAESQLISLFLQRLQSPTCLVAHNGNRFDFIILKKELEALNTQLPDCTYCIDSLPLFQTTELNREQEAKAAKENEENELADLELTAITAMEELEGSTGMLSQMQKLNETTPQRNKVHENYKRVLRSYLDVTPSQDAADNVTQERKSPPRSKRQLFAVDGENSKSPSPLGNPHSSSSTPVRKRFRLCDVYERHFGEPPKCAHYAESDVKSLLKCAIADGCAFVSYAEEHCVKFSDFCGKF